MIRIYDTLIIDKQKRVIDFVNRELGDICYFQIEIFDNEVLKNGKLTGGRFTKFVPEFTSNNSLEMPYSLSYRQDHSLIVFSDIGLNSSDCWSYAYRFNDNDFDFPDCDIFYFQSVEDALFFTLKYKIH